MGVGRLRIAITRESISSDRRHENLSPKGRRSPSDWAGSVGSAPAIPAAASEPLSHSRPMCAGRPFGNPSAVARISVGSGWLGGIRGGGCVALSLRRFLLAIRELEVQVQEVQWFGGIEAEIAPGMAAEMIVEESDVA